MKRIFGVLFFVIFLFSFSQSVFAQNSLENYCSEGIYKIPDPYGDGELGCGRAPNCGGKSYEDVEPINWQGEAFQCWDEGSTCTRGACAGEVPLCCYELERTGDPEACTWPERGYCHPQQCASITNNDCGGGDCRCGSPIVTNCKSDGCIGSSNDLPYIPLSTRVGGLTAPTATPTTPAGNPTATTVPGQPTATTVPGQPTATSVPNQPTATPTTTTISCEAQKIQGNFNCTGAVDEADFTAWKDGYSAKTTTLAYFEYWRRTAQP